MSRSSVHTSNPYELLSANASHSRQQHTNAPSQSASLNPSASQKSAKKEKKKKELSQDEQQQQQQQQKQTHETPRKSEPEKAVEKPQTQKTDASAAAIKVTIVTSDSKTTSHIDPSKQEIPKAPQISEATRKSLPTIEAYIRQLDHQASSLPNRRKNVLDWTRFLREDNRNPHYVATCPSGEILTFRQAFHQSKAFSILVESVLRSPPDFSSDVIKLFGLCLDGDTALHTRLYESLVQLSGVLGPYGFPDLFTKSIIAAVSSLRFNASEYHRLNYQIKTYNEVITQREEHLKTINGDDAAQVLQRKTAFTSRLIRLAEEKLQTATQYTAAITDSKQVEALLHETKNKLDDLVTSVEDAETNGPAQKAKLARQREEVAKLKKESIAGIRKSHKDLQTQEAQLIEKRRELEEQIRQINLDLEGIAKRKAAAVIQEKESAESFDQSIQDLKNQELSFDSDVQIRKKELEILPAVNDFVQNSFAEALVLSQRRTSSTDKSVKDSAVLYLSYIQVHLLSQHDRKVLLAQRCKFCKTKLASLVTEADEIQKTGMKDVADELARGISKMESMKNDFDTQYNELVADIESVRAEYNKFIGSAEGDFSDQSKTINELLKRIDEVKA
eukprot:TRINITY_DN9455_c0_g2_i1.p1 TRINITY_DN9455_c0_g2~~TRINITY_DN9455_c0_g2_i1.p1  ORF type:complete len:617 (+),score=185.25 TRINITY_DN9455_c0_g2_i1:74-1924(+)